MLYHILYPLSKYVTFFNVFGYITVRAATAFVISFILSLVLFPPFIRKMKAWKASQIIRTDGPESHLIKVGTPTMGGLVVIVVAIITMVLCGNLSNLYILVLLFCTISFGIIGMIDDFLKLSKKSSDGLHAKFKLISQIILALIVTLCIYFIMGKSAGEISIPFVKSFKLDISIFYIPFGVFLITGFSNAVNLTDGLDGLAGGLLMLVFATFGLLSYIFGHKEIADYLLVDYLPQASEVLVYCFAMLGGLIGFLWFNSHPADIFMGDTGSLSFGGIIGTIAMMIRQEFLLGIVGGVFVAETLSVIIQVISYKRTGKRVFLMAPLHHHFELKGWHESKIITRFWIIGAILAVVALSSLKLR
ncbi:MAG: phospho-N-acetylmuramoyl-pentapeptide-transferase [Spirochaetes bacterium GWF1_31_7]|nr:MAG: phospho-N-acetylmuramoyl-pentapeptide-transferase [Spirochaetes bacterium GWE1_32_154]OHD47606.1 MAG: phospho-N-acetylmuramoyl-pentapeptide-transferase [Spirochaetes bacterium GWE2_31_10]OHD51267.1 MAG: phospho-N-acetylmuramoyl-pentapeptide-transferase [Spirochaetes bacterium GWF1_31_7]HBD96164.1 phospho-N-acetylmuramoyl-pentapeptide-transferase [Spirochaetia bacterium]HBI37376.1 phospho-N-acetylmuramoyl-pentapeptide-transferase [Spirochaetia bacterium]